MASEEFEQRLRRLEDVEEIKKLKARYCEICDGGWNGIASHNPANIVALFTEDGVWDGGVYGRREGREALRGFYERPRDPPCAYHLLTNPIIEVDGDRATGSWHLTISLTQTDQTSMLIGGVFEDEYARTAEGWRIKYSRFTLAVNTPLHGSWSMGTPVVLSAPKAGQSG
jgi:hypothetical protein